MASQNSQDSRNTSHNENKNKNENETEKNNGNDNDKSDSHSLSLEERKVICGQKEDDFITRFFRDNEEESLYKEMEEWKRYKKKNRTKSFVRRMFFLKEKFADHQHDNTLWESNARYIEENKNALRYLDKVETSKFFLFVVERRILNLDLGLDLGLGLSSSSLSASPSQIVFVYVYNKINRSHNYFCIDYRKKHPEIKTIHGCTLSGIFDDCHPIYYRKFHRNRKYSKRYLSHVFRRTKRWNQNEEEIGMKSEMLYPIGSSFKKESPSTSFFK